VLQESQQVAVTQTTSCGHVGHVQMSETTMNVRHRVQKKCASKERYGVQTNELGLLPSSIFLLQPYCKYYYVTDRWGRPSRVSRGCIDAETCSQPSYTSNTGYCGYLSRSVEFCERCTLGESAFHNGCLSVKTQYLSQSLLSHATDEGKQIMQSK
jgi:hypothetical protein